MSAPSKTVVVGIAGRIGAGKTTAGKHLAEQHGFQYIRYSKVLADWQEQESSRKDRLQVVGWDVMAHGLQPELNRRLISLLDPTRDSAVDGLRHPVDLESLSGSFQSCFFLLFIDCPLDLRWNHIRQTGRYDSRDEFLAADNHAVEQQIDDLKRSAYAVISNLDSLKHLQSQVDDILQIIRLGGQ